MTGGLILQWLLGYNFSVAVWVGYIALFGIGRGDGRGDGVYLHESLDKRIASGRLLTEATFTRPLLKELCGDCDPS